MFNNLIDLKPAVLFPGALIERVADLPVEGKAVG